MESPNAEPEQSEERPEEQLSEPAITGSAAIASEKDELRSAMDDIESLFPEDRDKVTRAILRIAEAVEAISSRLATDSDTDSDTKSVDTAPANTAPAHTAPAHVAPAMKTGPFGVPEILWQLNIERLELSHWTSSNFLTSGGLAKRERSIVTAFYTEIPRPSHPGVEDVGAQPTDADFMAAYSKDNWSKTPQRVLIQSREALNELQQIAKTRLKVRPVVMVPPFKFLIQHREAIKSRLDELRQTGLDPADPSSPLASQSTNHNSIFDHLQCIHDFIQTDLSNYIGLGLRIRHGDIDEVLFEEVYHLFKPGDLVLSPRSGNDQLYQVYSVVGGRMRLSDDKVGTRFLGNGAGSWTDVRVYCYTMEWDGDHIGPRQTTLRIPYFVGTRQITDLDVCPVKFHSDSNGLRSRLRARGRKLVECSGHRRYTGESVYFGSSPPHFMSPIDDSDDSEDEDERIVFTTGMIRSDIYVDYKTFYSTSSTSSPEMGNLSTAIGEEAETLEPLGIGGKPWNYNDHEVDGQLSDSFLSKHRHLTRRGKPKENLDEDGDRLELLPSYVPAFIFGFRKWGWLDVDSIEDLDKSEEARSSGWDELVIPDKFSGLLLSLVSNHISGVSSRQWETSAKSPPTVQIDLVRGKGRGLIILLHGPPGSGKTSTAETIAAYTGRPLYAITCGDIGTDPKELEKNLVQHTRLAEKWGCVLLLDEADVFLMSRTYDNMHRNAMVSVFLRQLEYYSGILFLTTNIVGVIDEAFKSRIHVALEYPAVDEQATLEIWSNLLQRIKRDNQNAEVRIRFDEEALLQYAKKHYRKHSHNGTTWNGRQIRNAFQTAIGIGQYERLKKIDEATKRGEAPDRSTRFIRLAVASFKTVAETANDFEKYITKTRGDDRERAAIHQFRRDDHSREPLPKKSYRTLVGMSQPDQDIGASRAGGYRRYAEASTSPGRRRTAKGKEVRRNAARVARSGSESDEYTGRDVAKSGNTDTGSDEDIIEQDPEDEDDDE